MNHKEDKDVNYYKKRIINFSKYNESELDIYFRAGKCGSIVMSYPLSFVSEIYTHFSHLLKKHYPDYCDEKDIVNTLSQYGNIYTAKLLPEFGEGIYHLDSANILLYSFLDKLDRISVHELLHKLSYLKFNEDFNKMPNIYIEAGTELITNSILEKPVCRELVLGRLWTRSVGVEPSYLVETALINQFNKACNTEALERSILEGRNYIEPEIKSLIGQESYVVLFERLKDICRLEKEYWKSKVNKKDEKNIEDKLLEFQNDFLQTAFDNKIKKVSNIEEAQVFLDELMHFSDYRVKIYSKDNQKNEFADEYFERYFLTKKKELEDRFDHKLAVKDYLHSWDEKFPAIKLDPKEITERENVKNKINRIYNERESKRSIFYKIRQTFSKKELENRLDAPKNDSTCNRFVVDKNFLKKNPSYFERNTNKKEKEIEK